MSSCRRWNVASDSVRGWERLEEIAHYHLLQKDFSWNWMVNQLIRQPEIGRPCRSSFFFPLALQPQFGPWPTSMKLSVSLRFTRS
jgi:hypothetical protein